MPLLHHVEAAPDIAVPLLVGGISISKMVVGGVRGLDAAGLYRIETTILESVGKPAAMLMRGFCRDHAAQSGDAG